MLASLSSQYSDTFYPAIQNKHLRPLDVRCLVHGGGNFCAKLYEMWKVRLSGHSPLKWSNGRRLPHNPQDFIRFGVGIDVLQGGRSPACKSVQLVISVKCLGTPGYLVLYKCQLLLQFLAWVIDFSPAVLTGTE